MWTPRIFQYVQEQHSVHVFIYMCTRFLLMFRCICCHCMGCCLLYSATLRIGSRLCRVWGTLYSSVGAVLGYLAADCHYMYMYKMSCRSRNTPCNYIHMHVLLTHSHTYMYTCTHTRIHTCTHMQTHTHTHTHTHTCTQTQISGLSRECLLSLTSPHHPSHFHPSPCTSSPIPPAQPLPAERGAEVLRRAGPLHKLG